MNVLPLSQNSDRNQRNHDMHKKEKKKTEEKQKPAKRDSYTSMGRKTLSGTYDCHGNIT